MVVRRDGAGVPGPGHGGGDRNTTADRAVDGDPDREAGRLGDRQQGAVRHAVGSARSRRREFPVLTAQRRTRAVPTGSEGKRVTVKLRGAAAVQPSSQVDGQDRPWLSLLSALDGDEVVERRVENRMIAELPSYRSLDRSELWRIGPDQMMPRLASASSRVDPEHLAHFVAGGELRARQGVSATDMVLAYRIWHAELRSRAREVLPAAPESNTILLRFIDRITVWIDAAMVAAIKGHRNTELDLKRHAEHRNASVVRALLLGGPVPAALSGDAIAPWIDRSRPVWAVRSSTPDGTSALRAAEEFLLGDRGERTRGLLTLIDGDLCGFVYGLPRNGSLAPTAVGVGGPVLAEHLPHAFSL